MPLASKTSVAPADPRPNSIALDPLTWVWSVFMPCLPPIKPNTCNELTKGAKSLPVSPEIASHKRITLPCFAH
eukprot:13703496-Ditylum_brightwellii.AAC.1